MSNQKIKICDHSRDVSCRDSPISEFLEIAGIVVFLLILFTPVIFSLASAQCIAEVKISGEINEGTYLTVVHAFDVARKSGCKAILVELDTPGGIFSPTQKIVELFLNSEIPVIAYVPKGALSASAGSIILISANIAAMANGTAIGAATPVFTGYISPTAENKTVNYIASYVRDIASLRGRNPDIAEKFVTQSLTLPARDALKAEIIDVLADNKQQLLEKVDGMVVKTDIGEVTLNFTSYSIVEVRKPVQASFYEVISSPVLASILLILGIYLLIFGLTSPGVLPETVGVICLILALAGLGVFEINYLGIALILLAVVFLIAEIYTPTYGILGAASIICMALGLLILIKEPLMPSAFYDTFQKFVVGLSAGFATIMTIAIIKVAQIRKKRSPVGEVVGLEGEVVDFTGGKGFAKVRGEIWSIESDDDLKKGDTIVVVEREGLKLKVRKK